MSEVQSANVYREVLAWITEHPGSASATSLAKLVLSLGNCHSSYPISACLSNLKGGLLRLAVRLVNHYSEHGEDEELRAVGKAICERYPHRWGLSQMTQTAAGQQRDTGVGTAAEQAPL